MIHSEYLLPLIDKILFREKIDKAVIALKDIDFDAFVITGNSGAIFGGALAIAMDKGIMLVRKPSDKSHACLNIEGDDNYRRVVFLDDCMMSGKTYRRTVKAIRENDRFPDTKIIGTYLYNQGCSDPRIREGWHAGKPDGYCGVSA